ncbi:MAG: DUF839 domain-containing protein [Cyanobacteria bacterium J083]|nr:MAG: DUF839 domain-containing protein [Cyanobacteria bacterium J083]
MNIKRRNFLTFLGLAASGVLLDSWQTNPKKYSQTPDKKTVAQTTDKLSRINFQPIQTPIPLSIEEMKPEAQIEAYRTYTVQDDLVLPPGYTYDLIAAWGDKVGNSRFGYNNDYISFVETAPNEGFLTVNFEYISGATWMQTHNAVIGKELPLTEVKAQIEATTGEIDAFSLAETEELKAKIKTISAEGLIDQGIGIFSVRRQPDGQWKRTYSKVDRRITGISGLDNPQRLLKSTGAATAVFNKANKFGYEDGLGSKIIGTCQNCAGGTTPWGTVLSAEENFQNQVPELVMADGSAFNPGAKPFILNDTTVDGCGNVFGLAGNKYGWMVELDPANPDDYGTKHTWLGRYRHEAFGIRAVAGEKLAVYSGCDRRGGHLYKFISQDSVKDPQDKANSRLFEQGMLYGAKFNADGTGKWLPLTLTTPIDPVLPKQVVGEMVTLPNPDRQAGGIIKVTQTEEVEQFKSKFSTLADLYKGDKELEIQGAILIDAHFAANAVGITCTARPEDTIVDQTGNLYIAFTSGTSGSDGGSDKTIFLSPEGETGYPYGWIMKLTEDNDTPDALTFSWEMIALGGEPANGGAGFANPDNIEIDSQGNLWVVTDMPTSKHNQAVPSREKSAMELTGVFGNNSLWCIPTSGVNAGKVYPFASGPMECECTGPWFTRDRQTLFLAVQHPGEKYGIRQDMGTETREFTLLTTDGKTFTQKREVPLGSNWPAKQANQPPRPGLVAIRRIDNNAIA